YYFRFLPYFSELNVKYNESSTNAAHNVYLNYLITHGILGFGAYLLFVDYVLTGGELASLVVADSVLRLQPGVLAEAKGYQEESYWDGLIEYPQYTRPEVWEGRRVPEILLTGHHAKIAAWRAEQSLERTKNRRPDLYEKYQEKQKEGK
ncbi:MAG: hypothetical protein IIV90_05025, partial [Oscillospiraceae bacterium]|nr:hypothetical protein [Oscillospiraceae bacterium]